MVLHFKTEHHIILGNILLKLLEYNFYSNLSEMQHQITDLEDIFMGRTLYLVAGGPSLDNSIGVLRDVGEDGIILTVGTSAGKLLKSGICPDFVLISDASPGLYKQLAYEFDYERTSLIYLATASHRAVKLFSGRKYVAFQQGFLISEQYAAKYGAMLFEVGGSVSTLALDIGIQMGCSRIICRWYLWSKNRGGHQKATARAWSRRDWRLGRSYISRCCQVEKIRESKFR